MHRIDTPGHENNLFRQGNPFAVPQIPATVVGAQWLNAVQEELAGLVEAQGLTLDDADNAQLLAGILVALAGTVDDRLGTLESFAAPYDVTAGDGMLVLDTFGIAQETKLSGQATAVLLTGSHPLPKPTDIGGISFAQGEAVFWDNTAKKATTNVAGNHLIGFALLAAVDVTATVSVRLNATVGPSY